MVCWFDINGTVEVQLPPDTCTLSARVALDDEARGWDEPSITVNVSFERPGGCVDVKEAYLRQPKFRASADRTEDGDDVLKLRKAEDKWLELELGSFTLSQKQPVEFQFRLAETKSKHWKTGLFFDGLVIRASCSSLTNAGDAWQPADHQPAAVLRTPREECYPDVNATQEKERGLALVISMEKDRRGGSVDRERQKKVASILDMACLPWVDWTATQVKKGMMDVVLNKYNILEADECFVCFVNGHGGNDEIDGSFYFMDEERNVYIC